MPILLIRKKKWMLLMQNLNFNLLQQKSVYSFLKPTDLSVTNKGCVKWEEENAYLVDIVGPNSPI